MMELMTHHKKMLSWIPNWGCEEEEEREAETERQKPSINTTIRHLESKMDAKILEKLFFF